jgi:hypothetical protein
MVCGSVESPKDLFTGDVGPEFAGLGSGIVLSSMKLLVSLCSGQIK